MWTIDNTLRMAFAGTYAFRFAGRLILNQNDIYEACNFIYATRAVLYKHRYNAQHWSLSRSALATANRDALLEELAQKIWIYFNGQRTIPNNQSEFDRFHNDLCRWFKDELNTRVRRVARLPDAYYGNAQKMINILFKYLTCFDDYPEYADLFSYCHIPIDNYILRGFCDPRIFVVIPGVAHVPRDYHYNGIPWYEFNEPDYLELLDAYRAAIDPIKSPDLSYLGVEFYLWSASYHNHRCVLPTIMPAGSVIAPRITNFGI